MESQFEEVSIWNCDREAHEGDDNGDERDDFLTQLPVKPTESPRFFFNI